MSQFKPENGVISQGGNVVTATIIDPCHVKSAGHLILERCDWVCLYNQICNLDVFYLCFFYCFIILVTIYRLDIWFSDIRMLVMRLLLYRFVITIYNKKTWFCIVIHNIIFLLYSLVSSFDYDWRISFSILYYAYNNEWIYYCTSGKKKHYKYWIRF